MPIAVPCMDLGAMTNVSSYPVITKQNSVTLSTSTLKLSLHLLEIPNHSYALLSETLIGWSFTVR